MKTYKKAVMAGCLCAAILAGCGNTAKQKSDGTLEKVTTPDTYPIQTEETLTYWMDLSPLVSNEYKSMNDTPFAKELQKETGIKVEFVHPAQGQETERFNLMIASDDMTDIVESYWQNYSGGAQQAITDKVIIRLNDVIDKVSPNFKKHLDEHPEQKNQIITDDGSFYCYPMIRGDAMLATFQGFMIRKDLMEKVGETQMPQTIEDWDRILYKFKDLGVQYPLNIRSSFLDGGIIGAYLKRGDFYVENGTVKYGSYEKEFQNYIKKMAQWYQDGILDKDFNDVDLKRLNAIVTSGDVGCVYGSCGGEFGMWLPVLAETVPEAEFVPIAYPAAERGQRPQFGQGGNVVESLGAAISASCLNIELAARLLDFGYSEQGHLFYNFGVEGESYDIIDGVPTYRDSVVKQESNGGVSPAEGISRYARATYNGPFVQDPAYIMQYYQLQQQKDALPIWSDTDAGLYRMPNITMTASEATEFNKIMNDINTFKEERLVKYINGSADANDMQEFYDELKNMGIEKAIEIQQAAYDRYLNR